MKRMHKLIFLLTIVCAVLFISLYNSYFKKERSQSSSKNQELLKVINQQQQQIDALKKSNEQYQKATEEYKKIIKDMIIAIEEYNKKVSSYPPSYPRFTNCKPTVTGGISCYSY